MGGRHGRGQGDASYGVFAIAVFCGACAAGADGPPTGSATSGEPSTSATTSSSTSVGTTTGGEGAAGPTSGTGGAGGQGEGAGGAAGGPGTGGAGAGGAGTGGDGGAGTGGAGGDGGAGTGGASSSTGTGGTGGGEPLGVVTLLATGPTGGLAAVREGGGWSSDALAGTLSSSRPALAMLGATSALGLVRTSSDALHHTIWSGGASWAALTSVGGGTTTREAPAIDAIEGVAFATFHGGDFRHYYARYDGSFTILGETIGGEATPSFGPTAAGIAALGSQPLVAFAGDDDGLYAQPRGASTWSSATSIALGGQAVDRTPAVTTLAGDVPLVVASTNGTNLVWSRRTGGVWSSAVAVAVDALSADAPALAAISGGAVLAYRGTNGGVYASIFDAGAGSWSSPERVVAAVTTPSTPAVAAGVGNASVELAYIDAATGAAHHVRRTGSAWGAPVLVGGEDLTGVALATPP